jgi:signal transduction histidine kinase
MTTVTADVRATERLPRWWRTGVRTRLWWAAALAFAVMFAADVYTTWHFWPLAATVEIAVGISAEVVVGLLFWMWRPNNIVGPLLVAYASLVLVADLIPLFPESRLAATSALLFFWLFLAVYVHMLFVFPNGELVPSRWARSVLVCQYVWSFLMWLPLMLFSPTPSTHMGASEVTSYFYVGDGRSWTQGWVANWEKIWWSGQLAIVLAVVGVLLARLRRATPGARRRLLPLTAVVATVLPFNFAYVTIHAFQGTAWAWWFPYTWYCFFWLSSAGVVFGLARVRHARSAVSDLVVELGEVEPGGVRGALAHTLGDPSLVLGLWLADRGVWTDEQGRQITVPLDGSRGLTYVGERLAVLIHDRDLLDQPRLLESVGSAARLALENERLQAELRAQLAELRDSRARIVKAGDEERRRLERDLHDGAQQRLLGIGMGLQLLRGHLDRREESKMLLAETETELEQALAELRELARGIHPAVLTDHGLDAAISTLAERAPLPVTIDGNAGRLPEYVETAAYFVVAEALSNVAKYAEAARVVIRVGRDSGELSVEIDDDGVGGARPEAGGGLRGLADRVGALEGHLLIDSPSGHGTRIRAEIPIGDSDGSAMPAMATMPQWV